jgi:hypothetical protein
VPSAVITLVSDKAAMLALVIYNIKMIRSFFYTKIRIELPEFGETYLFVPFCGIMSLLHGVPRGLVGA